MILNRHPVLELDAHCDRFGLQCLNFRRDVTEICLKDTEQVLHGFENLVTRLDLTVQIDKCLALMHIW